MIIWKSSLKDTENVETGERNLWLERLTKVLFSHLKGQIFEISSITNLILIFTTFFVSFLAKAKLSCSSYTPKFHERTQIQFQNLQVCWISNSKVFLVKLFFLELILMKLSSMQIRHMFWWVSQIQENQMFAKCNT